MLDWIQVEGVHRVHYGPHARGPHARGPTAREGTGGGRVHERGPHSGLGPHPHLNPVKNMVRCNYACM